MNKSDFMQYFLKEEKRYLEAGDIIMAGGYKYVYLLFCNGYYDHIFDEVNNESNT